MSMMRRKLPVDKPGVVDVIDETHIGTLTGINKRSRLSVGPALVILIGLTEGSSRGMSNDVVLEGTDLAILEYDKFAWRCPVRCKRGWLERLVGKLGAESAALDEQGLTRGN